MSIMVNKESIGCLNSHHSPHQLGAPLSRCYRFGFEYQPQFECSQERKLCHHACIVLSLHSRSSFPFCFGALSIGFFLYLVDFGLGGISFWTRPARQWWWGWAKYSRSSTWYWNCLKLLVVSPSLSFNLNVGNGNRWGLVWREFLCEFPCKKESWLVCSLHDWYK